MSFKQTYVLFIFKWFVRYNLINALNLSTFQDNPLYLRIHHAHIQFSLGLHFNVVGDDLQCLVFGGCPNW